MDSRSWQNDRRNEPFASDGRSKWFRQVTQTITPMHHSSAMRAQNGFENLRKRSHSLPDQPANQPAANQRPAASGGDARPREERLWPLAFGFGLDLFGEEAGGQQRRGCPARASPLASAGEMLAALWAVPGRCLPPSGQCRRNACLPLGSAGDARPGHPLSQVTKTMPKMPHSPAMGAQNGFKVS